ncbi:hypothetical protein TWF281_006126 [Arthrobotrys megalospora]
MNNLNLGPGIRWDPREPFPPEHLRHNIYIADARHLPRHLPQVGGLNARGAAVAKPRVDKRNGFLPPLHASVKAQIIQDTAEVTITQLFSNESSHSIDHASYTFPLLQGCTVTEFVCRVGKDKVLKSTVKPKKEAADTFRDAVGRNETAALLEQNSPEIFTTTIGGIPANCRLKVEISFIFLLTYKFQDGYGLTTFKLPIYIAPRFGTPPPGLAEAMKASVGLQSLRMEIDVLAPEKIISVDCNSHATTVEIGASGRTCQSWEEFVQFGEGENPKSALVRLKDSVTHLDRDFVLEIKTEPETSLEQPQACIETHPELENHRTLMLTIPPAFMLRNKDPDGISNTAGGEIIFVADRSGSMYDKITALKSAMHFFLKGIPTDRTFNVWCFGDRREYLWPQSRPYSEENLQLALDYVEDAFDSNMGGTVLLPALKEIVAAKSNLKTTDIVTLTDGEVWDLDQTLKFVEETRKKTEGRVRFFTLGIGAAVSHALVEGIAKLGGGYAEVIPLASQGGWESRVVEVLKAALADHVSVIEIEAEGQREHHGPNAVPQLAPLDQENGVNYLIPSKKMLQSPARVSDLSPFLRNRVFMLFESLGPDSTPSEIRIRVNRPGEEPTTTVVPVKALKKSETMLHKLAARALLGDLERGQSYINLRPNHPPRDSKEEKRLVAREGERLGCKWSLVSKWTSFVAVEEPLEAIEANRDPFIDAEGELAIAALEEDLGLLHPRGAQAAGVARLEEPSEATETGEDEEIDTDYASSEASGAATDGWASGGDGDDHDDGNNNGSGPNGAQGGGNQQNDGRSSPRPRNGSSDASGQQDGTGSPDPHDGIPSFNRARGHDSALKTFLHRQGQRVRVAPVVVAQVTDPDLMSQHSRGGPAKISGAGTESDQEDEVFIYTDYRTHGRTLSSSVEDEEESIQLSTTADHESARDGSRSRTRGKQTNIRLKPPPAQHGTNNSPLGFFATLSPPTASGYPSRSHGKRDNDKVRAYSPPARGAVIELDATEPFTSTQTRPEKQPDPQRPISYNYTPNISHRRGSKKGRRSLRDQSPPEFSLINAYDSILGTEMRAPQSNLSASSAMMETAPPKSLSSEETEQHAFITRLLAFQVYDGSFSIPDNDADQLFGPDFLEAVKKVRSTVEQICGLWGNPEALQVAMVASIVALLEKRLSSQRALWALLVEKAKGFLKTYTVDVESVVNAAMGAIIGINLNIRTDLTIDTRINTGVTTRPIYTRRRRTPSPPLPPSHLLANPPPTIQLQYTPSNSYAPVNLHTYAPPAHHASGQPNYMASSSSSYETPSHGASSYEASSYKGPIYGTLSGQPDLETMPTTPQAN